MKDISYSKWLYLDTDRFYPMYIDSALRVNRHSVTTDIEERHLAAISWCCQDGLRDWFNIAKRDKTIRFYCTSKPIYPQHTYELVEVGNCSATFTYGIKGNECRIDLCWAMYDWLLSCYARGLVYIGVEVPE